MDHINNKHTDIEDYHISNLQLLTPAENIAKERGESDKQIKCKLNKPLSFYEDKLKKYTTLYEEAKKAHNAELVHKLRSSVAGTKARIRYYLAHLEEAEQLQAEEAANRDYTEAKKRAYHKKADTIKELKAKIKSARRYYKEALEAYGPDDFEVYKLKNEWKFAVYELNQYLFENRLQQFSFSSEDN